MVLCINGIIHIKINKLRLVVTVIYQWPCVAKMTGVVAKMTGVFTGSLFDIDPWFFASYVHQAWRKTTTHGPATCSLPSRDRKQSFLPLQYHRTVSLQQKDTKLRSLIRSCNHQRKAVFLPAMGEEQVGLIQHCCSVLLVNRPGQEWTGTPFRLD